MNSTSEFDALEKTRRDSHPDAESLSAFLEDALPDRERAQILGHAAACARCREVLFLAQSMAPGEVAALPAQIKPKTPSWTSWQIAWFAAAACMAVAGVAITIGVLHRGKDAQTARIDTPQHAAIPQPAAQAMTKQGFVQPVAPSNERKAARTASARVERIEPRQEAELNHAALAPEISAGNVPAANAFFPGDAKNHALDSRQRQVLGAAPLPPSGSTTTVNVSVAAAPLTMMSVPPATPTISPAPVRVFPLPAKNAAQASKSEVHSALGQSAVQKTSARISAGAAPAASPLASEAAAGTILSEGTEPPQDTAILKSANASQPFIWTGAARSRFSTPLPSGLHALSTAEAGQRLLALDSAGTVYLSEDYGKTWRPVAPQWAGRVLEVRASPRPNPSPAFFQSGANAGDAGGPHRVAHAQQIFEIVTDSASVWTSADGKIWKRK